MLLKLNYILGLGLIAFVATLALYPLYIKLLQYLNVRKTIRDHDVTGKTSAIFKQLHEHKAGTPTMGGGLFLIIMIGMIILTIILKDMGRSNNDFTNTQETGLLIFGFLSMGLLGLVDDILNVMDYGKVKGLSAKAKMISLILFSLFIAYRFYVKLNLVTLNLRPFTTQFDGGFLNAIFFFIMTIVITNAINITDGLDGLAGGLLTIVLSVLAVVAFLGGKFLTCALLVIVIAMLIAFLWFNINPAKIFMGDSGAFAMGGLIATTVYLLNARLMVEGDNTPIGVMIPFLLLFSIFFAEFISSGLQITWKKLFKKKLFPIAPLHHRLEHRGRKEHTIVMKFRLIQAILGVIAIILIFYQIHT